jgi:hypothetical protein
MADLLPEVLDVREELRRKTKIAVRLSRSE